jgi:hypothetical protein
VRSCKGLRGSALLECVAGKHRSLSRCCAHRENHDVAW